MQRLPLPNLQMPKWNMPLLVIFILGLMMLFSSCKPTRQSMIFMSLPRDTSLAAYVDSSMKPVVRINDILSIQVSSLNRELDEKFNAAASAGKEVSVGERRGYLVDETGMIEVHYLGKIKAAGMTPRELSLKIQADLAPYMKEPLVQVQFLNKRITVMGEVGDPKIINLGSEPMSILDALVGSGDFKENADRSRIMVIRDSGQVKQVKHINLEKHDVINTAWFYMQPNDVVYVMPRTDKIDKDERKRSLQTTLSLVASGLSLLIIILSRF